MAKYLNPFTDFGFKNLFGREYSKDVLIDFLNELYADLKGMHRIVDVTYTDKEQTRSTKFGKTVIYDIHCLTDRNHHLIIEMQVNSQAHFMSRAIYYLCRAISDQGEMGDDWKYGFAPVYGIYFTDFKVKDMPEKVKTHVELCDVEDGKPMSDKICLSFIQLPYFTKEKAECSTGFDQWIYVLKHLETMEAMPFTEEKAIFAKVKDISDYRRLDPEQRAEYDDALKRYRDYTLTIETAREEGIAKGIQIGLEKGEKKGEERGEKKGERKKALAVAVSLKSEGIDYAIIASATGLTLTEIAEA